MADKITLISLSSLANQAGFLTQLNSNFTVIANKIDTLVSRDGDEPNQLTADLDMNSQRLINLPDATSDAEPATYGQLQEMVAAGSNIVYNPDSWTLSGDGVETEFSINGAVITTAAAYRVSVGGAVLDPLLDYSVDPATDIITFTVAPANGTDNISVVCSGYAKPVAEGAVGAGVVGPTELANNAVTTAKIANLAVTAAKLASDAVTTAKILDANVTAAKLAATLDLTSHAVTVATQTAGDNSTKAASTAYADAAAAAAVAASATVYSPVRQTVLSGPLDSNGHSSFGGSTGSSTVTMSGTLIVTAANGFASTTGAVDRVGAITNASWTGLSTNGTMYLYLDIAADGSCTVGSGTLAPVYQWGGTYSTTNGQFTYNIQAMTGKVGNGSVANQTYRVYVGQVTVAGGVTTAITWYQLQGKYKSTVVAYAATSASHRLGITPSIARAIAVCRVAYAPFAVGDEVEINLSIYFGGGWGIAGSAVYKNSTTITYAPSNSYTGASVSPASFHAMGPAVWDVRLEAERGW